MDQRNGVTTGDAEERPVRQTRVLETCYVQTSFCDSLARRVKLRSFRRRDTRQKSPEERILDTLFRLDRNDLG